MDSVWLKCLALLLVVSGTCSAIKITQLLVPAVHVVDGNPLMLDCVYDLAPNETKLVVKWLLNEQSVYQWIPGSRPYPLNVMRNRVDEKYEAASEPEKMHRALMIAEPTWNMTGEYTCSVDSFQSRAVKSAVLQIVVPPKTLSIDRVDAEDDDPETDLISCVADDAYPEPQLVFQFRNGDMIRKIAGSAKRTDEGLYDVSAIARVRTSDLPPRTIVDCILTVRGTDYTIKRSLEITSGVPTTTMDPDDLDDFREANYDDRGFPSSSSHLKIVNNFVAFIFCICLLM
ncbi:uncharacterized protein DMENIID0001_069480 [Sergentomyia squamirostris]